jgi:hypothetical protein
MQDRCAEQAKEANKEAEQETLRVQQALKKKQEIVEEGKAKRQADAAEVTKLKRELAADAAELETTKTAHTSFVGDESARQSRDSAQLSLAKTAATTQTSDAEPAPDKAVAGETSSEETAAVACDIVACKGEPGETVDANHKGAGEWKAATIDSVNEDGTYTVSYSDGTEKEEKVAKEMLRAPLADCGGSISNIDLHATAEVSKQQSTRQLSSLLTLWLFCC